MPNKDDFMAILNEFHGHATNKAMRGLLGLAQGEYLMLRSSLLAAGLIKLGRGRGGTVHIVTAEPSGEEGTATLGGVTDPFPEGWR